MNDGQADIIIVGGGAAGLFAAIKAAEGGARVVLLEKTAKLLSKVKVSGGGRCNVTHDCQQPSELIKHYPRGGRKLRKGFEQFGVSQTIEWFEQRGVKLKTEEDGRMFPSTDDSQTIINCLQQEASRLGVDIHLHTEVIKLKVRESGFGIELKNGDRLKATKVIITTGGHNKLQSYQWLSEMGLDIAPPIPSLFTFNVPDSDLKDLMGLSVKSGVVQIPGSNWRMEGPILITHWGFSGPAVIKLSAWAAMDLYQRSYQFPILINWTGLSEEQVRAELLTLKEIHPKKLVASNAQFDIPSRLWQKICDKAGITSSQRLLDLPRKRQNKLIEMLVRMPYQVNGKTTFKEEFVTCGGVELSEVKPLSFEARSIPGLHFAGEVVNVDGVTGGFNFQHAWTSAYLAGKSAAETL